MRSSPLRLLLLLLLLLALTRASASALPTLAHDATNPIIYADVPDVAVIRVGENYYMASTTMHMSPGVPIMKSTDLVNWKLVSYAYDTLDNSDAMTLTNNKNAYGQGSWAASLRHHNGTYYVTTFSNNTNRTHIYTTRDIERGPWIEYTFAPKLHDHSLHFEDDGRVYMVYGTGDLRLIELAPDLSGPKPDGLNRVIIPNASAIAGPNIGLRAEGSQLRKINGKYYLFTITWPKGGMRTQLVFRSDNLTGPFEGRIFVQDQGVAQGCLIDTPTGDWYAMLFQDNGAVGRTPFLIPVLWKDGWPVATNNGKAPATLPIPTDENAISGIVSSDEFTRNSGDRALPLAWQWNHNPDNIAWSLTARPGWLRLTTAHVAPDFLAARNTLTQRTFGPTSTATTHIDISNMRDGDSAGLAALQKKYACISIKTTGTTHTLIMTGVPKDSDTPIELANLALPSGQKTIGLRLTCDFRDRADIASFSYSLDGETWHQIGPVHKMFYTLPHFMGYRFALFNYATKSTGGFVDFDYFRVTK